MEFVLIAAIVVVAAAGLYVALTFNKRTRQTTAPLIDQAVSGLHEQIRVTADDLRRQLRAISEDLHRDRDEQRLDGRKIQGRLDHADSRISSMAHQFLAELDAIKRRSEQIAAQQDQQSGRLRRLAAHVTGEPEPPQAAVPGRLYVSRLRFSLTRAPAQSLPADRVAVLIERCVAELPPGQLGDLGDGLTAITRAESDPGFRDRLAGAASDYAAARWADPAFAAVTERWITRDTFPETAAAEVCDRIGRGLSTVLAAPLEAIGSELRLPGAAAAATAPGAAPSADRSADLILQPVTRPPGEAARLCEMIGVAAGAVTGLHPFALAAADMLADDESGQALARGIRAAARTVFAEQPGLPRRPSPPARLEPASVREEPARDVEITRTWPARFSPLRSPLPGQRHPDDPPGAPVRGTGSH